MLLSTAAAVMFVKKYVCGGRSVHQIVCELMRLQAAFSFVFMQLPQ